MGNLCSYLRNNNESNDPLLFTNHCEFCNKTFTYNNYNKHIIYLLFITPVTIILYCFRDGSFKAFPLELVALIKPLFFLLLLYCIFP